jgi:hypothetical protein
VRIPIPRRLDAALRMPTPIWLVWPLMFLGVGFIVLYPLGHDWFIYGFGLFIAVLIAIRTRRRRYRIVRVQGEEQRDA